ncbi:MAG: carbohydrate porin [Alphaproteobacteria bacterium]|nr:carbohydrate porin [Alphaproteobacteria bacterium]
MPDFNTDTLTGDWGGFRNALFEKGVSVGGTYKADLWDNLSGGRKTGATALNELYLSATVDGKKLYDLPGSKIFVSFLGNSGGRINDYAGTKSGIDNVSVSPANWKIYEAWVQQKAFGDVLSVRAGQYAVNSEFYVTDASGLFINPGFGFGNEFTCSGVNGPSIYPYAAVGVRVKAQPSASTYVQAAVLDGVPGDPYKDRGTHIRINPDDGLLAVAEAGYRNSAFGHYGIGAWHYTMRSNDWVETWPSGTPKKDQNEGVYLLAERTFWQDEGNSDRAVDTFIRFGTANENVNRFSYGWSTGIVYYAPIAQRKDSQVGLGIGGNHNSDRYRQSVTLAGGSAQSNETHIELTYYDKLMPWLSVQPDLQYTLNPNTDPHLSNSWTIGMRIRFTL